jgi:2-desacetyl-2-hydroxyethyl bacteriochlorophyllide A dehydrogenase
VRALQVTEDRRLAEAELPDPEPGPGEVAIDIAFCGICGSDLHMLPSPAIAPGTVMGHEFSGKVAALGDGVEGWSAGDRVAVLPATACGECPSCRAGQEHLCAEAMLRGHGLGARQGAFAERVVVDPDSLFRLPDSVNEQQGALVEPLAVGVHGVRKAELRPADPVCVLGAGPIGVMTALALRATGSERIVVIEPGESRRTRIEALGFTGLPLEGVHEAVIAAFDGELPAGVFECAGHPSGLGLALELVRPAGVIVALGVLEEPVPLNQLLLIVKEASVLGAFAYQPQDFEQALELLAAGEIPADELITEVAPLESAQAMVDELRRPGTDQLKVLLRP